MLVSFPAVTALALYDEIDENACRDCGGALESLLQHRRHTEFFSRTAIGRGSSGRKLMAAWGVELQRTASLEVDDELLGGTWTQCQDPAAPATQPSPINISYYNTY